MSLASGSRSSPLTIQEFSELVSSAFNLHDADLVSQLNQPLLSVTPPSPHAHSSFSDSLSSRGTPFMGETAQHDQPLRSPSLDDGSPHLSSTGGRSLSRTITALRMFQQVRTRASAFILRSRVLSSSESVRLPSPVPFEPLPRPCPSPAPSASSFSRALSPWSMVDLTRDRPRSRADSLPRSLFIFARRDSSPPPLPRARNRPQTSEGTRSLTPALRSFFDDSPVRSKHAYSRRPATSASTTHPLYRIPTSSSTRDDIPTESLPSFFEDTGYQVANPRAPSYSRPHTPTGASLRIHARLPQLRKSKSSGYGLLSRGGRRESSKSTEGHPDAALGYQDLGLWNSHQDKNMPSPLTRPRDPPPVPDRTVMFTSRKSEDAELPLPPAYVFERRGSATSNSTGSTRSNSSFSARLSNLVGFALPNKMRTRGRSKLNLDIAAESEAPSVDSSPSTLSSVSSPSTPSSPTSTFSRSREVDYPSSTNEHALHIVPHRDDDALAIGRVLTPEADPFAKADIAVPFHGTPRPLTPRTRRASSQDSPASYNRVVTWDESGKPHPVKRVRNSLPASPMSTAPTFPSSCSVYVPGQDASYTFPAIRSPAVTPNLRTAPSSWSPFTPASSSPRPATSPSSSPSRSPRSILKPAVHRSHQPPARSPPSPTYSTFPLPPAALPPAFPPPSLPPPERSLPSIPSSPAVPPVPPKDRCDHVSRAHKSLPPSPQVGYSVDASPPPSPLRIYGRSWKNLSDEQPLSIVPLSKALQDCSIKALADRRPIIESEVPRALGEPWSGTICDAEVPSRPTTPNVALRPESKRRSMDSTRTVTASPGSLALHETVRGWDSGPAIEEGDSYAVGQSSCDMPSPTSTKVGSTESDFWSPRASPSTMFYSARSSFETGEQGRTQSLQGHSGNRFLARRTVKAASAGPCA